MKLKIKIINDLNVFQQAEELGVKVWQTPSFLFIAMGVITIIAMTATYFISRNYDSPEILVVAESIVVVTILTIGNSVIQGMEQMARINKMKSEFVSVASHQLRTPLSAIKWETELIISKFGDGLSDKQKQGLEAINTLSARMTRLVSDLLDVARIDQGRLILKKEPVDLAKITREIVGDITPLALSKNIRIILEKNNCDCQVLGDQVKTKLVVENIVSNAVKYSLQKGIVKIGIKKIGNFINFTVEDNGVGIPEEQQKQVFNKFFRSDNVVKYQTEGTGLGLYIAKNIVEQLGGKIWFKSREGVGTIFNFTLPVS